MGWKNNSTAIINIVLGMSIGILNLFEVVFLARLNRKLKNFETVLISLSVADMLFGISNFCIGVSFFLSKINEEVFEVNSTTYFFFGLTSILHLTWITIDRFWAVYTPIKHNYTVTRKRIYILLVVTWISTTFVSLFLILHDELIVEAGQNKTIMNVNTTLSAVAKDIWTFQKTMETTLSSFLIAANILFLIGYGSIIFLLVTKKKKDAREKRIANSGTKNEYWIAITCASIAASFSCFTLPFALTVFIAGQSNEVVNILLQFNSAANCIVYFVRNNKELTGKAKSKKPNSSSAGSSTQSTPIQQRKVDNNNLRMEAMKNSSQTMSG